MNFFKIFIVSTSLLATVTTGNWAFAQEQDQPVKQLSAVELNDIEQKRKRDIETIEQLKDVQLSLQQKVADRNSLAKKINLAGDSASKEASEKLKELDSEIELLNKTFEQIATGGIDLSVFGVKDSKFDWREELILVVKPLIENIKGLTEKPRKIEKLKQIISEKSAAKKVSINAIGTIEKLKEKAATKNLRLKLINVEDEWRGRVEDLDREVQLAQYQLDSLEGRDVNWLDTIKSNSLSFVQGRGLTIVLLILVALLIWATMKGILFLFRKRTAESKDKSSKVHYRLAAYAYRLLTGVMISVGIMMVLYIRRDLLMLAIVVIIFLGVILALKNLLPQYITEGRILLNMGGVREKERIVYNGVPWEVSSINMFSTFTNPELKGGLRLPISQMHSMISRVAFNEPWFPSSAGDWILDEDGNPVNVIDQTIDVVELKDLNSTHRHIPTDDYYRAGYRNITRADTFRIAITFGIDYSTQKLDVADIENAFIDGLKHEFENSEFAKFTESVNANFHSAGDSSLNYLMIATFNSDAAFGYNRIKRLINRACVKVCSAKDWPIPFPQMSVHIEQDNDLPNSD